MRAATPEARFHKLPNGLQVRYQNRMELGHFYDDIFVKRVYAKNGIQVPAPGADAGDGGVVFDVGANIGLFSTFALSTWPGCRVYSFEPAPPLFEIMSHNTRRFGHRSKRFDTGLSDHHGEATFTFYPQSSGMSSFYGDYDEEKRNLEAILRNEAEHGVEGVAGLLQHADDYLDVRLEAQELTCRLMPISDVIAGEGVERIDLLKVDVQKAEVDVLRGLADGDWPKVRQIVLEVHDTDGRVAEMERLLGDRGFAVETEQDEMYGGSDIFNLYARREGG